MGTLTVVSTFAREFQKTKLLGDRAIAQLSDDQLHARLDDEANSVAVLMQHMAGNMRSRWTDFLTSDGEKPWRQRDAEFDPPLLTRAELLASWENGWGTLFGTLEGLTDDDLACTVTIRGESQAALAALARQLVHYAGHAYQIVLLAKHLQGPAWTTLSIARGQSSAYQRATRVGQDLMDISSPTVLWRLWSPEGEHARAVLIPGDPQTTLTLFVNDVMDRAENFDGIDVALFRADDIKILLLGDGWREEN